MDRPTCLLKFKELEWPLSPPVTMIYNQDRVCAFISARHHTNRGQQSPRQDNGLDYWLTVWLFTVCTLLRGGPQHVTSAGAVSLYSRRPDGGRGRAPCVWLITVPLRRQVVVGLHTWRLPMWSERGLGNRLLPPGHLPGSPAPLTWCIFGTGHCKQM